MIEEIHIRDLGVITDAVLPLGPGLTILSGETGAGKTMAVQLAGGFYRPDAGRCLLIDAHGHPTDYADLSPAKSATDARCLLVALIQVLAGYETSLHRGSWRENGETSRAGRYLRFLNTIGYSLSDVENYAISDQTA